MEKHYEKIPYLLFSLILFILLSFSYYLFDNKSGFLIYLLILVLPIFIFVNGYFYAYKKNDFSYLLAILTGLFYLVSCLIMFNFDIYIYCLLYIFISLCGQGTGYILKRIKQRFKK